MYIIYLNLNHPLPFFAHIHTHTHTYTHTYIYTNAFYSPYVVMISAFLLGFGDACYNTQV